MRKTKITLEEAIKLENNNEISIYFTNQVDIGNIFNPIWYQNYVELANKYRKVDIGDLINYLDPEYEIEILLPAIKGSNTRDWIYLYGKLVKKKKLMDQNSEKGKYVYVLTNKAYPHICKIGKAVNPQKRIKQINNAGSVVEWELRYALPVIDDYLVEYFVHKHLDPIRCHSYQGSSREFFEISLKEAIEVIENLGKDFMNGEATYY